MTINHRAEAERLLASADTAIAAALEKDLPIEDQQHAAVLTGVLTNRALGHAMLVHNEEQAATTADLRDAITLLRRRESAMRELVATHIVEALASQEDARRTAALHLTRDLHEADANVDDLINAQVPEGGWAPFSAPTDDPWAKAPENSASAGWIGTTTGPWGPGVTHHQAAMNVVTLHLAEALLDGKSEEVRTWARGLAHELRRERIDLIDEIGQHMQRMALGGPTNEVPF